MIKKTLKNKGFTLLEMLVSLGIFAIVAVIAVGSLVRITGLNKQAQTLQSSMNNLGYALESISRDLRMSTQFQCMNASGLSLNQNGSAETSLSPGIGCDNRSSNGAIIAYESNQRGAAGTCNLIYAFGFFKDTTPNKTNNWLLKKAQQSNCGDALVEGSFSSLIDETNTNITGFRLSDLYDALTRKNHLILIRLIGYAGDRGKERNDFDIETAVSGRLNNAI